MTVLQQFAPGGWAEVSSEGVSTIYLCIIDEGMITSPTDTPANTQFKPRVKNAETFSIKRMPPVWPQANTTGVQGAAYGQLVIDNYDGMFDFLIATDLRDTTVIFQLPPAGALLTGTTMLNAPTLATAIIDSCIASNEDEITMNLKDTIARLDKILPVKVNPPYVDANAAMKMVQISLGPFRNRQLIPYDTANRIFQLADAAVTNITRVTDMAAPLDPNATPPQYTPALNQQGMQLATMPVGLLTCEGSSVGQQAVVPGAADVLNGSGLFPGGPYNSGHTQGLTLATAWLGLAGYSTTSTAVPTGTGPYTVAVNNTGTIPAVGDQVYITDGTNKLLGTVTSGSTTTSIIITRQDSAGTVTSIASGSTLIRTGAPTGWTFTPDTSVVSGGPLAPYPQNVFSIYTSDVWWGSTNFGPSYGFTLRTNTQPLVPGSTYRISFALANVQYCGILDAGGFLGGVVVGTAQSTNQADYIAGFFNPLSVAAFRSGYFVFEYTVPVGGSNRDLFFMFTPTVGSTAIAKNNLTGYLYDVKVELLGQYVSAPLRAISMTDYFTEILVNRAGEASSIFNSIDTNALAVHPLSPSDPNQGNNANPLDNLVPFACCFDSPPNILDALRMALDNVCACLFTDNLGVLRTRRLTDPSNPIGRVIKADFNAGLGNFVNVDRPMQIAEDPCSYLTTLFGARRNWKVYNASDFVTDQSIVTQNTKSMFMRTSQLIIRAMKSPASNYNFAVGAPQFDTTFDLASDCQLEADRVVGIWSANTYSDGTSITGKRRIITFTARYDDPAAVGATIQTAVTNIMFGDIILLTHAAHGLNSAPCAVLGWEIYPFANQLALTVLV